MIDLITNALWFCAFIAACMVAYLYIVAAYERAQEDTE